MDNKERERLISKCFIIYKDKLIQKTADGSEPSADELEKILKLSMEAAEYFESNSFSLLKKMEKEIPELPQVYSIN
tara:strand:+ start:3821 stop:4048 length:228 start_codon:yes stop_codon:yes gene_type:complete